MQRVLTVCLATALLPALAGRATRAAPEQDYFLGEPWEAGIERGIEEQRRAERRRTPLDTVVGRAERTARREGSVVKLYLLARAYGLRAQWHWNEAAGLRDAAAQALRRSRAARDRESAAATYRDVLRQAPRCYFAHHDMGVLSMLQESPDTRTAFSHFRNAYTINRRFTPTQRQLVKLYLDGKQFREAIPLLQRLVQLVPDDEEARWRLITALGNEQRYDEAYRELEVLLAKHPDQPRGLAIRSLLDTKTGRFDRAIATYTRLARLNPNVPTAFLGIVECAKLMEKQKLKVDLNDLLFAWKGLKRLVRDPDERKTLEEHIRKIEHAMAAPAAEAAGGPPTIAQLLHGLEHPDETIRIKALAGIMLRSEPATSEVVRAVARHIDEKAEASPAVRAGAVRALGRLSGTVLVPLIRLKLSDAEVRVRRETADTLVGVATRDSRAADPVIAILGLLVRDRDVELASSARLGILRLAGAVLPDLGEDADDAAHRRAFEAWWGAVEGENVQIGALDAYHRIGDKAAHEVLVPYLASPSFHVFRAAYRALERSGPLAGSPALREWHAAMPRYPAERQPKANWQSMKRALDAWVARRPGP